ncbi:MAG: prephenate dehydratase, partial [Treponemataceae bacterium]|nr:prephenate dehydratase [Treponemataceae bacterium]
AFAEQAVGRFFDNEAEALPVDSFRGIFQAVADGRADFGMVPIENSLAGSVYENYDNLSNFEDVSIVGAVHLRIQHALLGVAGASVGSVRRIYSHPQGFAQCSKLLSAHPSWEKIDAASTSTAAKLVADARSAENAAIASGVNAKYYGLEVLQDGVEDDPRDYTRFVVIAANHAAPGGGVPPEQFRRAPNMASFMFCVRNEPGALYECLGVFQKHRLNLTRLESRPINGQPWRYWFYADAELSEQAHQNGGYVEGVLQELRGAADEIRLLGIYPEARLSI